MNSLVEVKHFKSFEKSWSRSAVYGLQDQFVDDKPLFPSCTKKSISTPWRPFQFEVNSEEKLLAAINKSSRSRDLALVNVSVMAKSVT